MGTIEFMNLSIEDLEVLNNNQMIAIRGGFDDKHEFNDFKTCVAKNNGKDCTVVNNSKSCLLINNSMESCSLINTNKTCSVVKDPKG